MNDKRTIDKHYWRTLILALADFCTSSKFLSDPRSRDKKIFDVPVLTVHCTYFLYTLVTKFTVLLITTILSRRQKPVSPRHVENAENNLFFMGHEVFMVMQNHSRQPKGLKTSPNISNRSLSLADKVKQRGSLENPFLMCLSTLAPTLLQSHPNEPLWMPTSFLCKHFIIYTCFCTFP